MGFYLKIFLVLWMFTSPPVGRAEFITQGEWAKRLVKALGLEEAGIPKDAGLEDYISLLKGGTSIELPVQNLSNNISFEVNLPASGIYNLLISGTAQELILRIDESVNFVNNKKNGASGEPFLFAGKHILKRGIHKLTVISQDSGKISAINLTSPCLPKVEPPGGWQKDKTLTFGDKAVTIIQALNMEDRLPGVRSITVPIPPTGNKIEFSLDERGVYTIYTALANHHDSELLIDNCFHSSIINSSNSNKQIWKEIGTYPLSSGRHVITFNIKKGKLNGNLIIVKRDTALIHYLNLLKQLNPSEGELTQKVSQEVAIANLLHPVFASRRGKGPEALFYIEEPLVPQMPSEKEAPPYTSPISPVLPSGI